MKKEIFLNTIFTFLISLLLFVQNRYFVLYMNIETLGLMKLFTQLLQYLDIVEMGLGSAAVVALYKPLANKDNEKVSIILNTIKHLYNRIGVVIFILGLIATPTLPFFINISIFSWKIYLYWILYVFNTIVAYLFIKYTVLFTANQEYIYIRFIQCCSKIICQLLQIFLIIYYQSFIIFILVLILDNIIQYIFFKRHFKKNYSYIYKTNEKYPKITKDMKNLFWHRIAGLIVFNTDLILISKFTSIEVVGIYASYQLVAQLLNKIIEIIFGVLRPKVGKLVAVTEVEEIYKHFKRMNIIFLLISSFISYNTFILINSFIDLWLGKGLNLDKKTVILIVINIHIKLFRKVLDMYKDSFGFFDDIQSPILESIINLIVSIILGMKLGLNGVILGTITSNIIIVIIYKPVLVFKRCFNKGIKEYLRLYMGYLFLIFLSLVCLEKVNFLVKFENIKSWLEWIIFGIKNSGISLICLIIIFTINREFREFLSNKK